MCNQGGESFRRIVFELDGFTCLGYLHEMFVAVSEIFTYSVLLLIVIVLFSIL